MNMAILGVRLDSEVYPWDMCEGEGREGGREREMKKEIVLLLDPTSHEEKGLMNFG